MPYLWSQKLVAELERNTPRSGEEESNILFIAKGFTKIDCKIFIYQVRALESLQSRWFLWVRV